MKWETLKKKVAEYVEALPPEQFNQIRCNAQGEGRTVQKYLDDLDIRLVAGLREHARDAFPKGMRRGKLWADKDDKGHWRVTTEDPRNWSRQ